MSDREAALILHHAYDLLSRPDGWVQRTAVEWMPSHDYNAYCLGGGIDQVVYLHTHINNNRSFADARLRARDYVTEALSAMDAGWDTLECNARIVLFNDTAGRTQEEVLQVLEKAITLAEERVV